MKSVRTTITTNTASPQKVEKTTEVTHSDSPKAYETKKTIFRAYQLIWYVLGVMEVLLAFRFILRMVGANALSSFVMFIYNVTNPLVIPFQGIVRDYVYITGVIEWATVIAAFVYAILAWGIIYLFQLIKPVTPEEVETKVDNPDM